MQITRSSSAAEQKLIDLVGQHEADAVGDYAILHTKDLPRTGSAISYFEFGDPAGRPMLLLHGLSVSGLFFEQYHSDFLELGIRAIAPCMVGASTFAMPTKISRFSRTNCWSC